MAGFGSDNWTEEDRRAWMLRLREWTITDWAAPTWVRVNRLAELAHLEAEFGTE